MGGHKIHNQHSAHFVTFTVVGWVNIFTRKVYKDILIDSLKFCMKNKDLKIYAYVIMSNHVHLIMQTDHTSGLSGIIRDFKKYTSSQILRSINNQKESRKEWMKIIFKYHAKFSSNNTIMKLWQSSNRPIELESPKWFNQKILYIHNNPVNEGIVKKSEDYLYSSASNYISGEGILDISIVDFGFDVGYVNI